MIKARFVEKEFLYDGSQLRPLFAYKEFSLEGDSILSWIGPCNVSPENMKDGEDFVAGESIAANQMLHFIVELFGVDLHAMVFCQRLFSSMAKDLLQELNSDIELRRDGDDIYWQNDKKLNISIASKSSVSSMVHCAFNITNEGTPVPTSCLNDFNIEAKDFSVQLMEKFQNEIVSIFRATKKVFPL